MIRLFTIVALLLCVSLAHAGPPKLGTNCGVGASSTDPTTITGSAKAGKITLGERPDFGYDGGCTVTLDGFAKVPSCSAMLESNADPDYPMDPYPLGTTTTQISGKTALFISSIKPGSYGSEWDTGYTISYLCVGP